MFLATKRKGNLVVLHFPPHETEWICEWCCAFGCRMKLLSGGTEEWFPPAHWRRWIAFSRRVQVSQRMLIVVGPRFQNEEREHYKNREMVSSKDSIEEQLSRAE